MNLLQSKLKSNVEIIDATGLENIVLQTAMRYGIPFTRRIINSALDLLAQEEKLAEVPSDNID